LYTFGGGEHGQLGHNDRVNKLKPTLVQAMEGIFVSQISCGWSHSIALTSQGQVYSLVEKLKDYRVVRVASYNEHTAALVEPRELSAGAPGTVNAVAVTAAYVSQMRGLINDDEFSDVTFIVESLPIHAHRAVLAQRSEHFAAMFRSGMRESTERTIPLPNISRRAFLLLLEYVYTDTVKIEVEHAIELYIAADLFNLDRLREMCCTVVRRNLNAENSGPLLQAASEAHCHVLRGMCMTFVVENFDTVSKTDGIAHVSHGLLLEILSRR
jgi:RCC1 and BTB domain-containing protein